MIVNHLARLLGERRMSAAELARLSGLRYASVHALRAGTVTRADFGTLDALCRALGVGVGDILEYVPD